MKRLTLVLCLLFATHDVCAQTTPQSAAPIRTRSLIQAELNQLEQERRQIGLGLPIASLIGGGVATASGIGLVVVGALLTSVRYKCGQQSSCDEKVVRDLGIVYIAGGAVAIVVGGVFLIIGGIVMSNRGRSRRELGDRIRELRRELEFSVAGLHLSVVQDASGAALQLQF